MATILLSVQQLKSFEVYDRRGEKLGVFSDVMLDIGDAKARYAVLDPTSMPDAADKKFAVPLPALRLDTENECFVLDVDRDSLARSEGFSEDSPPDVPDPQFAPARSDASSRLVSRPRP
jgi:sporulation protein YlmC with PRC-barrel domain